MGIIIGIDIGGSTTKIVGFRGEQMLAPLQVKADDPLASVYGAFGKFTAVHGIDLPQIETVMMTGVGADAVRENIYHIRTCRVNEFVAVGLGGLELSVRDHAVIVSMGTGTAYVRASRDCITHMGGTGVGGGTLLGLSHQMLNIRNFESIIQAAEGGDIHNIDLQIKDIARGNINMLRPETTAANFGKISDMASRSDIALGIINMVFETIGMMAAFASRSAGGDDVVLTGNLTTVPQAKEIFETLKQITGVRFLIPENAEFATAIGAAKAYGSKFEYTELK